MADKKRQKWMRDKGKHSKIAFFPLNILFLAEIERMQLEIQYDQLKHQLSPGRKQHSVSPGIKKPKRKNIKFIFFVCFRTINISI